MTGDERVSGHQGRDSPRSDVARAEAFSDGVLAIVITLLVLDLRPPPHEPGHLLEGLLAQWPTYLAYLTSYAYVGVVWTNHKAAFRRVRRMDRGLHWANLGVLFSTALLPFPTALMADAVQEGDPSDIRTSMVLYSLIGALVTFSWLVFYQYLTRHHELVEEHVDEDYFAHERIRAVLGTLLYLTAGVAGSAGLTALALAVFLALPIFYAITTEGLHELMPPLPRRLAQPPADRGGRDERSAGRS
jgi:uncharacterized membrane protein